MTAMSESNKTSKKDSPNKESQASKKKTKKSSGNKTLIFVIVGLVLFVLVLMCVVGVLVLRNYTSISFIERFSQDQEETNVDEEDTEDSTDENMDTEESEDTTEENEDTENEDSDSEVGLQDFEGDFVTGEVPSDWQIIEYVDGDGTSMLATSMSYDGLTALRVLNGNGDEVFYMGAVSGIGGIDACDEFYKFGDTDEDYQDKIIDNSSDMFVTTTVIDLTGQDYSEFDLFGVRARRVGSELYKDSTESTDTFDTSCGISHAFWWMDEVSFTVDGSESYSYQVYISGNPPEAELDVLDDILDSLEYSE